MRAFSANVVPFSSGSSVTPASRWLRTVWPMRSRMRRISAIFPGLLVAAMNSMLRPPSFLAQEQRVHKGVRVEFHQVVHALAHAHKAHGQAQLCLLYTSRCV